MLAVLSLVVLGVAAAYWKTSGESSAPRLRTEIEQNHLRIDVQTESTDIQPMHEARFAVTLTDAAGKHLPASEVEMTYAMPRMFCGQFNAEVSQLRPGAYLAVGVPVMKGSWEAKITVVFEKKRITMTHPFRVI
nr:FixH family protein [Paenibacillus artemisiicola]